eukprot:TRINITY_DN42901_c0_g1_i1.p1 TRINITY_DN42901_c0_g1~~TRINITY_DN42901_c0_g1_i1.p1  ORF type:complete len:467 (+),score=155.60 TRINITY_DN42901_c0_g1_i1:48-1403(+)
MDGVPPSREELERLSLPDLLVVSHQLGVDVSYVKERSEVIDALANQRRQQLTRYSEELQKFKIRLEGQAQEMDLAKQHYQSTYDRVEQAVSDKFAQLHDLLLRKEVEIKGHLLYLKNKGDSVIEDCSEAMLRELDMLNDTIVRCQTRSLDVLDITPSSTSISVSVPTLTGRCFDFHDVANFDLAPLRITLDLTAGTKQMTMEPPYTPRRHQSHNTSLNSSHQPPQGHQSHAQGHQTHQSHAPPSHHRQPPAPRHSTVSSYAGGGGGGGGGGYQSQPPSYGATPQAHKSGKSHSGVDLLTFATDPECFEFSKDAAGLSIRMLPSAPSDVTGTKAREVFSGGSHVWKVRCDNIQQSIIGLVDATDESDSADHGFFWWPTRRDSHGMMGRPSPQLGSIPVVKEGDVLKLTYDGDAGTLRVALNGIDRGLLCTDLYGQLSPCFIFAKGEGLTLMQ